MALTVLFLTSTSQNRLEATHDVHIQQGGVDGNTLARGEVFAGETEEKASLGCWTLRDFLAGGTDRFERYDAATAAAEAAVLRLEQGAASALSREALEAEQEGASKTKAGARACRADGGDDAMDLDRPSGTAPVPSPDMGNTPHTHVDVHPHDPALADLPDGQGSDTTSHVVVSTPSCCSEAAADAAEGQTTAALDPSQESYR